MKLDLLYKIQIATFGIQYMANSMQQLKNSTQFAGIDISQGYDDMLNSIEEKLTAVYEEAANFLNAQDAICQIDINVMERLSDVILFGKDDTEEDYYRSEPNINASIPGMEILRISGGCFGIDTRRRVFSAKKYNKDQYIFESVDDDTTIAVLWEYDQLKEKLENENS